MWVRVPLGTPLRSNGGFVMGNQKRDDAPVSKLNWVEKEYTLKELQNMRDSVLVGSRKFMDINNLIFDYFMSNNTSKCGRK